MIISIRKCSRNGIKNFIFSVALFAVIMEEVAAAAALTCVTELVLVAAKKEVKQKGQKLKADAAKALVAMMMMIFINPQTILNRVKEEQLKFKFKNKCS